MTTSAVTPPTTAHQGQLTQAVSEIYRQQLVQEVSHLYDAVNRQVWARDPVAWARQKLREQLWSGQRKILRSIAQNRRTAVQTAHQVGKSHSAGIAATWWLDTHEAGTAFVLTTAPTQPQVEVILWKEIGRAHAKGNLFGRVNETEWKARIKGNERAETIAMGRKPSDYTPSAFQGVHERYVLIIVDEANGVRGQLWNAIDSVMANDDSKILEIGNPDDPSGEFYSHCKPGSGYHVIQLSAFDSPNFTGESFPSVIRASLIGHTYVEEKRKKWAPTWYWVNHTGQPATPDAGVTVVPPEDKNLAKANPMWHAKILGEFPEDSDSGGLIPLSWVKAAQRRTLEPKLGASHELGVDVGGGGDATAVCERKGPVFRIRRTDHDPDTMSQCGKIIADLRATGASLAKIDKIGIGWGIVDRGRELNHAFIGINVGEGATQPPPDSDAASDDERFLNKKAELWWAVRDLFESGNIDIEDDTTPYGEDLAAELCNVRYERMSTGKIKIKDKRKNEKDETVASPNLAESLMLAAAPVPPPKQPDWVTW